jgi:hypothetical protein
MQKAGDVLRLFSKSAANVRLTLSGSVFGFAPRQPHSLAIRQIRIAQIPIRGATTRGGFGIIPRSCHSSEAGG